MFLKGAIGGKGSKGQINGGNGGDGGQGSDINYSLLGKPNFELGGEIHTGTGGLSHDGVRGERGGHGGTNKRNRGGDIHLKGVVTVRKNPGSGVIELSLSTGLGGKGGDGGPGLSWGGDAYAGGRGGDILMERAGFPDGGSEQDLAVLGTKGGNGTIGTVEEGGEPGKLLGGKESRDGNLDLPKK